VSVRRRAEYLSDSFLDRFTSLAVIAAHPDDEVIGAGALLQRFPGQRRIVHITDGAPEDMRAAHAAGCASRGQYAQRRRDELYAALAHAGLSREACIAFGVPDQHASLQMAELSRQLARTLDELRPDLVVTHPYEGGHPDHDAAAFAVRGAVRLVDRGGSRAPAVFEMTSYHAGPGGIRTGAFLPDGPAELTLELTPGESSRKAAMLACFESQAAMLAYFGDLAHEMLRPAPAYDFTRAPHAGLLFYEHFDWGMDGPHWRSLAADALAVLGLEDVACV
jgi:LmbE family N-acetylglucosaminyl deacetylase